MNAIFEREEAPHACGQTEKIGIRIDAADISREGIPLGNSVNLYVSQKVRHMMYSRHAPFVELACKRMPRYRDRQ
ncbi:hypothetical protein DF047_16995 [Burkholderia cenocepacia]|nr:hypothetical protein DF047_16995 [Burkholderia cenocepacia]